jgi:hypothetical protein
MSSNGGELLFTHAEWRAFVAGARAGNAGPRWGCAVSTGYLRGWHRALLLVGARR